MAATVTKTSLKKSEVELFQTLSRLFHHISFSSSNVGNLFLNWSSGNENQNSCFVFMSSTRREIRHFHFVVVQWRKTRDARAKLMFVLPVWNLFLFCCSLWRRSRCCWSSLMLTWERGKWSVTQKTQLIPWYLTMLPLPTHQVETVQKKSFSDK